MLASCRADRGILSMTLQGLFLLFKQKIINQNVFYSTIPLILPLTLKSLISQPENQLSLYTIECCFITVTSSVFLFYIHSCLLREIGFLFKGRDMASYDSIVTHWQYELSENPEVASSRPARNQCP